jgi:oligogalacturonide lyase
MMNDSVIALAVATALAGLAPTAELASRCAAEGPPTDWVEATGYRVLRLTGDDGGSSFYFHQNGYTADGDKLTVLTRGGLSTLDLKTLGVTPPKVEQVVEGRAGNVVVGRKTRLVFYTRGGTVYATHLDTRDTRRVATLPEEWRGGSGLALNADETMLAGSANDTTAKAVPKPSEGSRAGSLEARWAAGLPMVLYAIQVKTGEVKKVHEGTDWFNHVQFSPSDPTLLLFCHEGPWHKVDRIWTIRTDGKELRKVHTRTMDMEIAGHEFFSADGKTIWYDLQTPKSKEFWLAGVVVASGKQVRFHLEREHWSVHFNAAPDGTRFAGDGGGPNSVAAPGNGPWIYLYTPEEDGSLKVERLVDLSRHNYRLEPNVTFTPDGKWIVFRSNMHGPTHVYAVAVKKSG